MDLNLLDLIYDTYYQSETDEKIEEVEEFNKKYIKPLLEQNSKEGMEMEEMFSRALSETDVQAFKNGFRVCMHLTIDYLKCNL